jgi:hypothetical protein
MEKINRYDMHPMVQAYLEAALFADWPEENTPRSIFDATQATIDAATADCMSFLNRAGEHGSAYLASDFANSIGFEQVGHDFWLTRQGHGAGFWDRPEIYGEHQADGLAKLARHYGQLNLHHTGGRYWAIA